MPSLGDRKAWKCHSGQGNKAEGVAIIGSLLLLDSAPAASSAESCMVDMVTELEILKKICGCLPRRADAHAHKEVTR